MDTRPPSESGLPGDDADNASNATDADAAVRTDEGGEPPPSFLRVRTRAASRAAQMATIVISIALLLLLSGQLALIYRTRLLVQWPVLRPALETLCAPLGCRVAWPMRPDLLAVVSSELQSLPGTDVLEFNAVLRSRATFALELPAVELTLTDSLNRAVARRVFVPADYRATLPDTGMPVSGNIAAGADLSIRILFEMPGGGAAGFEAYPFYP